jgi:hypothetical protein
MTVKQHYVSNEEFLKVLVQYKKDCAEAKSSKKDPPSIPNYIGECFMKIAEGLSHRPNFINYTYRDEMIADGVENCLMYFSNFNPEKSSNPFAYFTQIIYYAFLRRIQKEKKQMYVKYKSTEQLGILDEFEMMEFEDGTTKQFELYDNITEFIENFEEKKRTKKKAVNKLKGIENFIED